MPPLSRYSSSRALAGTSSPSSASASAAVSGASATSTTRRSRPAASNAASTAGGSPPGGTRRPARAARAAGGGAGGRRARATSRPPTARRRAGSGSASRPPSARAARARRGARGSARPGAPARAPRRRRRPRGARARARRRGRRASAPAGPARARRHGAQGELPDVGAFRAHAGEALVEVLTEEVPDDWDERWKRFYFPVLVSGRIYVRPPWEQPAQRGGVEEVVIDPGGAFGTGTHPTTRMCLELMLEAGGRRNARSFADLGCGSGVLRSRRRSSGSTRCSRSTRTRRDRGVISQRPRQLRGAGAPPCGPARRSRARRRSRGREPDRKTAIAVAQDWSERGERPGTLIASGILRDEADGVAAALTEAGLIEQQRLVSGDWAAVVAS